MSEPTRKSALGVSTAFAQLWVLRLSDRLDRGSAVAALEDGLVEWRLQGLPVEAGA